MATRKSKKVVLKNRYDADRRAELDMKKYRTTQHAELTLGLREITKTRVHFYGRWAMESSLGKLSALFHLKDEVEGLGEYEAHLSWFAITKDGKDPKIAVKIDVVTVEEENGRTVYNNTRPTYYDVIWADNIVDAIADIFDKLEDALATAEQVDYNKLPKNLQG